MSHENYVLNKLLNSLTMPITHDIFDLKITRYVFDYERSLYSKLSKNPEIIQYVTPNLRLTQKYAFIKKSTIFTQSF